MNYALGVIINYDHVLTVHMMLIQWLIEAVKDLFLEIEHRQCARHVLSNFKKKFHGA